MNNISAILWREQVMFNEMMSAPDYPHNTDMEQYIKDYAKHFKIDEIVKFYRKVVSIEKQGII
jgi:cation diffusion facilitator CzcD-associated flavoprotein CzcO